MKAVSTIVNEGLNIIGFELQGSSREFGLVGKGIVRNKFSLESLVKSKATCDAFSCASGRLIPTDKNSLNELPMLMNIGQEFKPIDNTLEVIGTVYSDGVLAGYDVKSYGTGKKYRFRIKDLTTLSYWFKGMNYYVASRTSDNGAVTYYISGKAGMSLANLPRVDVVDSNAKVKKVAVPGRATNMTSVNPMTGSASIIGILADIEAAGGRLYMDKKSGYKAKNIPEKLTADEFIPLGIGEIGNTNINISDNKVNVNINFRNMGNILVNGNQVMTYTVKSRSIMVNGEVNMNTLYVIVPQDGCNKLKQKYPTLISDVQNYDSILKIYRGWEGDPTLQMIAINVEKLDIMSNAEISASRLDKRTLFNTVGNLVFTKASLRVINNKFESYKSSLCSAGGCTALPKHQSFNKYDEDTLVKLRDMGVNLITGAFNGTKNNDDKLAAEAAKLRAEAEAGQVIPSDIEVSFGINRFNTIPTAKALMEGEKSAVKYISPELRDMVKEINSCKTVEEGFRKAQQFKYTLEKRNRELVRKLWMHKMSALVGSRFNYYDDGLTWTPAQSRKKSANAYTLDAENELASLQLSLVNIDVK